MAWNEQVHACFGVADCEFAIHPLDEKRAKAMIKAAKAEGASFDDLEKEIVWHCYKNVTAENALQDHIAKQVSKAKKLWN